MKCLVFVIGVALFVTGVAGFAVAAFDTIPLPHLNLVGFVTISGISSGADVAAMWHIANSDITNGSAIFAGQAPGCAIMRMDKESQFGCAEQPAGGKGPGCVGMPWGSAKCIGCDGSETLQYDHCKTIDGAPLTQLPRLLDYYKSLESMGSIPPLSNLIDDAVYLYHGIKDMTYNIPSVNNTADFFNEIGISMSRISFEAQVPSGHCWPTADIMIPSTTCGVSSPLYPAIENCGYDGAGAALFQIMGGQNTLKKPANISDFEIASLFTFLQSPFDRPGQWAGQGRLGYIYIPRACVNNGSSSSSGSSCRLHIALHGCGMSASNPAMGTQFVQHTGLNAWAETNQIVILYPQMGGFIDFNITAPSNQLQGGCFDGYGQSGSDYAHTSGPQMVAIRKMVEQLYGGLEGFKRAGLTNVWERGG